MRHSLAARSSVLLLALTMAGGFVYWRAFAARPHEPARPLGATPVSKPATDPLLMPGSKSAILVEPSAVFPPSDPASFGQPVADVFSADHTTVPAGVVLPGAPANAAPPPAPTPENLPTANPAAPPTPAQRRVFLSGSKSMILPDLLPSQTAAQPVAPNSAGQPQAANPARPPAQQRTR